MSEIPGRPRLDGFTAPDATHATRSDKWCERAAQVAMPGSTVDTVPNPLAILRVHRPLSPSTGRDPQVPRKARGDTAKRRGQAAHERLKIAWWG